jgi:hypothetical protein
MIFAILSFAILNKKRDCGERDINYCPKLRDVIYERPLQTILAHHTDVAYLRIT